jgi:F-type H+-transporting ATPase subunit c
MKNIIIALATIVASAPAFAQEAAVAATSAGITNAGIIALAAGIAIGIGVLGGALGQAKTAAAALEGIARNPAAQPKIFIPMIIGLALTESLVILAFLIANGLAGKV